ncbi:cation diffusion facilitator family transporter [Hahella ganghwensis]|uniref:cation diffusion facilitator family transporter n=1 Tax=Hahella ganghwensis TaxID=286420 RepID=UPI00035F5917|nr:cation diffusion facilitator family transporter [Hahella ganghwensis]
MTSHSATLTRTQKSQLAQRVTIVGMILDIILGVLKITIGLLANSYALIADGIHSFTDAGSDILVILITRFSHQAPDEEHPYGHGKFETLGTVVLGSLLIAVAGAMAYDSTTRLISGQANVIPGWQALLAALLSIAGKEWIYHYTLKVGKLLNSDLIIANAWHSRTDALSSIVVLMALLGALAGYPWLDAAAAVIVALLVAKIGWDLAWNSIKELVETSVPNKKMEEIERVLGQVEGVRDTHFIRGRYVGPEIVLDLHLQVDPTISVSEGHHIGLCAVAALRQKVHQISDITLHIDAEEDGSLSEQMATVSKLPQRNELTELLHQRWQSIIPKSSVKRLLLHYLRDKVHIEVMLNSTSAIESLNQMNDQELKNRMLAEVADIAWIGSLRIWKSLDQDGPAK